jgi:hypothetical protein
MNVGYGYGTGGIARNPIVHEFYVRIWIAVENGYGQVVRWGCRTPYVASLGHQFPFRLGKL